MKIKFNILFQVNLFCLLSYGCSNISKDEIKEESLIIKSTESEKIDSTNSHKSFIGEWYWEKNNENKDFTLIIKQKGDSLLGSYCYVLNQGDKIDCNNDENQFSFGFPISNQLDINTKFYSTFTHAEGVLHLSIESNKLHWVIKSEPSGEYYAPKDAFLLKK